MRAVQGCGELISIHSAAMAGLYLRGLPRPFEVPRRNWPRVLQCLRENPCQAQDVPRVLASSGFAAEAGVLGSIWARAEETVLISSCLTYASPDYPIRLFERLGASAPPAFWWNGKPLPQWPPITVVGSRAIDWATRDWCGDVARAALAMGCSIVSGGAPGCDRAAMSAAGANSGLEIWPCGIGTGWSRFDGPVLALASPLEPFSSGNAMERNALVYALSPFAVICAARFREGGTWHGAVGAHRRRLCRLVVRDDGTRASAALTALGAIPLREAACLAEATSTPEWQTGFDFDVPLYRPSENHRYEDICEFRAKYAA